jgi:hypothetical protein
MFRFLSTIVKAGTALTIFGVSGIGLFAYSTNPTDESFNDYHRRKELETSGIKTIDNLIIDNVIQPRFDDYKVCKIAIVQSENKESGYLGAMNNWRYLDTRDINNRS